MNVVFCHASQGWGRPHEFKDAFGATLDFVGRNRFSVDVSGDTFRVLMAYAYKRVLVKFVKRTRNLTRSMQRVCENECRTDPNC